jgi:hypothetical protein
MLGREAEHSRIKFRTASYVESPLVPVTQDISILTLKCNEEHPVKTVVTPNIERLTELLVSDRQNNPSDYSVVLISPSALFGLQTNPGYWTTILVCRLLGFLFRPLSARHGRQVPSFVKPQKLRAKHSAHFDVRGSPGAECSARTRFLEQSPSFLAD